jgi:HEPN domain-containing protein
MKKQVENWILLADKDMFAADILLKDEYPLTNIVAFHCQQAIEKYLKAFLIENDIPIIKTHDLIKLNGMTNDVKDLGLDEKKLMTINEVYIESRYPGELGLIPDGMPSNVQVKDFLAFAKEVKLVIKKELFCE